MNKEKSLNINKYIIYKINNYRFLTSKLALENFNIRKIGLRNLDNDLNLINGNNNIYFLLTLHR